MRIILLGPPGAGKGTQARFIADYFSIPSIATGNILRAAVAEQSELGKRVEGILSSGELVPDELIIDLMKARIAEADCTAGFLFDGFPRTLAQAEALSAADVAIDWVIELVVPDDEIIRRMQGRRVHLPSGRAYHLEHCPPKQADCDDITGEPLVVRDDDRPETVKKRLALYHQVTQPIALYYREQAALALTEGPRFLQLSGVGKLEAIRNNLLKLLNKE